MNTVINAGVNYLQKMAVVRHPGYKLPLKPEEEEEERGAKFCMYPSRIQ